MQLRAVSLSTHQKRWAWHPLSPPRWRGRQAPPLLLPPLPLLLLLLPLPLLLLLLLLPLPLLLLLLLLLLPPPHT